jgi:tRNA threonylcarbamoyladenosine biosynthesis protein TsaB
MIMALILSIETATPVCSIGLSENGDVLALKESSEPNIHAARVAVFIDEILNETSTSPEQLSAVAVSMGPGSYTGLRIGVSSAKGLSYSVGIPLIAVNTLQAISAAAIGAMDKSLPDPDDLFLPMLDARRMEVYTALYNSGLEEIEPTTAQIIGENSFKHLREKAKVHYFGNGAAKCEEFIGKMPNFELLPHIEPSARYLAGLAYRKYENSEFVDTAYFEPFYLKDFIAGIPKVKGLK